MEWSPPATLTTSKLKGASNVATNNPSTLSAKTKQLSRVCGHCGKPLVRKRFNDRLEDFGVFSRRKYCGTECMGEAKLRPPKSKSAECRHARRIAKRNGLLGTACGKCGSTDSLDLHHNDGNRTNNTAANLQTLCDSCHTEWHWQNGK